MLSLFEKWITENESENRVGLELDWPLQWTILKTSYASNNLKTI